MGKRRKLNPTDDDILQIRQKLDLFMRAATTNINKSSVKTNSRERARVRDLSEAFRRLKNTLPWVPADTKLSKLDTLRLASSYIVFLGKLLQENEDGEDNKCATNPETVTWPYTFQPEKFFGATQIHEAAHGETIHSFAAKTPWHYRRKRRGASEKSGHKITSGKNNGNSIDKQKPTNHHPIHQ